MSASWPIADMAWCTANVCLHGRCRLTSRPSLRLLWALVGIFYRGITFDVRFCGRYWRQSGHALLRCKCLLLTQSGHWYLFKSLSWRATVRLGGSHEAARVHYASRRCCRGLANCRACATVQRAGDRISTEHAARFLNIVGGCIPSRPEGLGI